ncbi:MAG: uracil-DNA glycosylase family 4 [Pirellulaceae bacterium]|jgi:uracil-DNA glycosylase family 4
MSNQNNSPELSQQTVIQYLQSLHRAGIQQIGKIPEAAKLAPAPQTATTPVATTPVVAAPVVAAPVVAAPVVAVGEPPKSQPATTVQSASAQLVEPPQPVAGAPVATPKPAVRGAVAVGTPMAAALQLDQRQTQLDVLRNEVSNCTLCEQLCSTRTQTVFGVGTIQPRLCFLGEAPGADEDREGEPFVGAAGQLLNKIIKACTLQREEVYILNTLKCRPPGNRNPLPDEVSNCRGYFERQLEILNPEYICCLGSIAAQNLLETKESVGRLRGKFHNYRGIKVMVTYHPAYLLRTDSAKRYTWDDMKMLMEAMGIQLPG